MPCLRQSALIATVIFLTGSMSVAATFQQALGEPATPTDAKEANQGVYVRDSAVAAEKLALGERMERLKEWDKAADIFQEILEKYPDRVVQSAVPGKLNQYTSVAVAVQQRLAKWPDDGLRAYRNRYESTAADLLAAAGRNDYAALNSIYQRFFITEAGKSAALRLIDLYLESGEFPAAAWLGDRLLQWHPTIAADRPRVLYRVAMAYYLSGDKERAAARAEELKNTAPNATGTVRGQDVNLAETLAKDMASPVSIAQNQSAESWRVFMGDATRSRISTGLGRAGARPFSSIDLASPSFAGLPAEMRQEFDAVDKLDKEKGLNIGIIPSVDHGDMFFQDGTRVYAVSLDSGTPLAGWAQTYGGDFKGEYVINTPASPTAHREQHTITVTDKEVLAVMGQPGRAVQFPGQVATNMGDTRLVCLDRITGKERWSRSARDFPDEGNVRSLSLGGSPLVVGDNVYVCGTGGKSAQFDDCYIFCLDRLTGNHKWSAYVCSATTGQVLWGGDNAATSDVVASVSYASGRLYVLTNLGAVAALDAYSGGIIWLDAYERDVADDPRMMRFGQSSTSQLVKPWSYNPAVVSGGHIFALPSDGKYLTVYDAGSGDTVQRVNLTDVDNADTLIGLQGNKLIVSSDTRVFAFNWEAYDPAKFTPRSGAIYWGSTFSKTPIRGRGFMTADSVFIPTKDRLFRIGLTSGKIEEPYPPFTRDGWADPEGPGNVIVTEDKVVIAGPSRVSVYTDLAVARSRLDKEVAAAPKDPELRLRYAEMLFVAGDQKAAMTKLDEAFNLLGGEKNLTPGPSRDRAFHTALTFAQKLSDPSVYAQENRDIVDRLFDESSNAASSASQQVEYRISRAKFSHNVGDSVAETRLYQEILADDAMRNVTLGDQDGASTQQAGALAESQIDSLIKQVGPQIYAPYAQAAKDATDAAHTAGKPDELLAVARKFPNAPIAPEAMFYAADTYESANQNRRATQVLRQLYFKYPQANKAAVLEAMARNYLEIPGHLDVAASRLAQGAKIAADARLSKPLKLPESKTIENATFSEAAAKLKQLQADAIAKSLPAFKLPQGKPRVKPLVQEAPIPGIAVLVPMTPDYSRLDRAVTVSTHGEIGLYATGSAQPLWLVRSLAEPARECAWIGNNLAIWNPHEIAFLSGENGNVLWRIAMKSLPDTQVVKADEATAAASTPDRSIQVQNGWVVINGRRRFIPQGAIRVVGNNAIVLQGGAIVQANAPANQPAGDNGVEQILSVRPAGDRLVGATSTGRLFGIDLADGTLAWQTRLTTGHPIERLLTTDDFAVARFTDGVTVQIIALDAATGQVIRRYDNFRVDGNILPVNEALSPDGTLVITLPDHLIAKDLYEPGAANKWETPVANNGTTAAIYIGSEAPDQLIAQDGRVLAVSDTGSFVRVLSLDTGEPLRAKGEAGEVIVQFPTGARSNTPVHLRISGEHLYVFGPQSLKAFDLDNPLDSSGQRALPENADLRDLFIGSDYLIALDDPGVARFIGNPDAPSTNARLLAYSRATVNGRESGLLTHDPMFPDPAGISTWQPANGGFFYLTGDQKLHFLKSNNANS